MNKKNISLYAMYFFSFFKGFMVLMPVVVLFFQSRGLSVGEVFALQSVFAFAVFALEVPTGFIGDRRGRKTSLMVGAIFSVIGYVGYISGYGFVQLMIAEIILALGYTCMSGSDAALIYDTLYDQKRKEQYKKVIGRYFSLNAWAEALAAVCSVFLVMYGLMRSVYGQVTVAVLACVALLFVKEPMPHMQDRSVSAIEQFRGIIGDLMRRQPVVLALLLYGALLGFGTFAMTWFTQPYMQATQFPLWSYGWIWAGVNAGVAFFARKAASIEKALGRKRSFLSMLFVIVAGFTLLAVVQSPWSLLVLLLFVAVRSISGVVVSDYVNQLISSDRRATLMSMQSLLMRGFFALWAPLLGYVIDVWSLSHALGLTAFTCAGLGVALLWRMRHRILYA